MSDFETPRPRAQFGEYATPDEQQRARGLPEPANTESGNTESANTEPATEMPPAAAQPAPKPARPVDRVVTLVLLAVGLFVLLNGIPGYLALPEALQLAYDQLGAGTYPATEATAALGVTALVLLAIIWVATAVSAWFAMKRGRLAWWIALLGGVLSFIVSITIMSIALSADPGFIGSISLQNLP